MAPSRDSVAFSKGLLNGPGQNNCFLNSAVQVLWHLDIFRRSFRELSGHTCMAESCIFCALKELFAQLQFSHESALPPDALRRALAESFFDQQRFQLGFMDDAAECFENILMRIHYHIANSEAEDMCNARHCIPHQKFAMTLVEQSVCGACGATSEPLPFTQMVHYVSASALTSQAKQGSSCSSPDLFGQLLKKAGGMGDIRDCPSACGAKIQIRRTLTNWPEIVSVGVVWDSERPSLEHIMSLLGTLRTSLRLSDVFHTPSPLTPPTTHPHELVGVVTYYGKHYSTFFFHTKLRVWIYFDDATVREVGPRWEQVVEKCRRGRYQPLLLLFATPEGSPIDTSAAPKSVTRAPKQSSSQSNLIVNTSMLGGRRSLTPSPEKPSNLGTLNQRRAVTPNPDQSHEPMRGRPLLTNNDYQNLTHLQAAMFGSPKKSGANPGLTLCYPPRVDLQRRDSGNWSGDRNSASSSSSTSLENPYQYFVGKMQMQLRGIGSVPRSPTSLKSGDLSSSSGGHCDPGYDSYSLSSNDSLPLQQSLKHNLQLAQIPEGHQSPTAGTSDIYSVKNGLTSDDCERLCREADQLLGRSEEAEDLVTALSLCQAAASKARAAMDAPYSNPQTATAARMKHNTCIMKARSLHKRLEEPNRHPEGRHSREGSGCSGRGSGSHSRQNSRDKGNHSRQNSRELLTNISMQTAVPQTKSPKPDQTNSSEKQSSPTHKNIEIYATLPKSKKGLLSRATKTKNVVEDEEYLLYDRPGRSLYANRNKSNNKKEVEKRAKSEERNVKNQKEKEFISNSLSKDSAGKKPVKQEDSKQGKKQHKIRRKLLMGGLIKRKNRSMPDLREDEIAPKGTTKDDSSLDCKLEKQPTLSGYLSEGHLEFSGNPNLEKSKLMRKGFYGSKMLHIAKVPPPPPVRTTSQLTKSERPPYPLPAHNSSQHRIDDWMQEPQSLPYIPASYESKNTVEAVTYANGMQMANQLVTTALVHQEQSPSKPAEREETGDMNSFPLPPYPSPLNSVSHSRQASEDFPPPPSLETLQSKEIDQFTKSNPIPGSLLAQVQEKRQQILSDVDRKAEESYEAARAIGGETWLRELQAKQAALRGKRSIQPTADSSSMTTNNSLSAKSIEFSHNHNFHDTKERSSPVSSMKEHNEGISVMQQLSSVKDLKSRFEQIKMNKLPSDSDIRYQKYAQNACLNSIGDSRDEHNIEEVMDCSKYGSDVPDGQISCDIDMKISNLSIIDPNDQRKKSGKKKNVTFCEQVVLVATAEEDEVDSYIPNPILERVLRSVLHKDSPPQENRETTVQSVVPLKRTDSINNGQKSPSWSSKDQIKNEECQNRFFEDITKDLKVNGESNSIKNFINANLKSISSPQSSNNNQHQSNQQTMSVDSRASVGNKGCNQQQQNCVQKVHPSPLLNRQPANCGNGYKLIQQFPNQQNMSNNPFTNNVQPPTVSQQQKAFNNHNLSMQPGHVTSGQPESISNQDMNQQTHYSIQQQNLENNQSYHHQHIHHRSQQMPTNHQPYQYIHSIQQQALQSQLQSQTVPQYQQNGLSNVQQQKGLGHIPSVPGQGALHGQTIGLPQQSPVLTRQLQNMHQPMNCHPELRKMNSQPLMPQNGNQHQSLYESNPSHPLSPNNCHNVGLPHNSMANAHQPLRPTNSCGNFSNQQQTNSQSSSMDNLSKLLPASTGIPQQNQHNLMRSGRPQAMYQQDLSPPEYQHPPPPKQNQQSRSEIYQRVPNPANRSDPDHIYHQQNLAAGNRYAYSNQNHHHIHNQQIQGQPSPSHTNISQNHQSPMNCSQLSSHSPNHQYTSQSPQVNGGCYYQQFNESSPHSSAPSYCSGQSQTMNYPIVTSQPQSVHMHGQQSTSVKCHPPYQHPPPPKNLSENSKIVDRSNNNQSVMNHLRTSPCHLCRKKQVIAPSIYCTDCDFYMSRLKAKT